MQVHTSAYVYTFTPTDTQVYTDVHIFKEIKQTQTSLTHWNILESWGVIIHQKQEEVWENHQEYVQSISLCLFKFFSFFIGLMLLWLDILLSDAT